MLKIQRASAGSGKTYALAKAYILNYISTQEDGRRRLLTRKELPESLRALLAITFTNKATDEMKNRIIEKLHSLAWSKKNIEKIDYLSEFMDSYGWSREDIAATARAALDVILEQYSSFNISTIDSFFQTVLRTFTYESEISDSYQVQINDDEIAQAGLNDTLDSINNNRSQNKFLISHIRHLMQQWADDGKKWNLFDYKNQTSSLYTEILNKIKILDKEEFKVIKDSLEKWFGDGGNLPKLIKEITYAVVSPVKQHLQKAHQVARSISALMDSSGISELKSGNTRLTTGIKAILESKPSKKISRVDVNKLKVMPTDLNPAPSAIDRLRKEIEDMYQSWDAFVSAASSPEYTVWKALEDTLPLLELIRIVTANTAEMLRDNGFVRLSDTNTMLRDIISDDETPFIYERLGTKLHHFLIDEFQDTSMLQWENLRPLVSESESHDYFNLIIGDAKQSIYRFRNAAPELITSVVPLTFPNHIPPSPKEDIKGYEQENSNYRSAHNIVRFNNSIFHQIVKKIDNLREDGDYFQELYSNVVQRPMSKNKAGIVSIKAFGFTKTSADESQETEDPIYKHFLQFPDLINKMLAKGYLQKEIAILVRTHTEEAAVVRALTSYNDSCSQSEARINFVSESALKISASAAVDIIVNTLETIASGVASGNDARQNDDPQKINWYRISSDFNFYAASHPDVAISENIRNFLRDGLDTEPLSQLLDSLPTHVLPALTEGIIEVFVPQAMQRSDAPFISAFQDIVLEYCSMNPADINSFLSYWHQRKDKLNINSPADSDAVQILTVHKSKGLEFKCVIIPNASYSLIPNDSKPEWIWVKPRLLPDLLPDSDFPPYWPIKLTSSLGLASDDENNMPYLQEWRKYSRQVAMDSLNLAYVAFTRAVDELHIFVNTASRNKSEIGYMLLDTLGDYPKSADDNYLLSYKEIEFQQTPDLVSIEIGNDNEACQTASSRDKKMEDSNIVLPATRHISQYPSYASTTLLHFQPSFNDSARQSYTLGDPENPDDNDANPRAFGTLMHSLMEDIYTAADIDRALRRMRISGKMSRRMLAGAEMLLRHALNMPEVKTWFDGSMQVLNERTFISRNAADRRPDRIMIDREGNVMVVDYKFGESHSDDSRRKYESQVKGYMEAIRNMGYKNVTGYLWYMRQKNPIFKVE